ncbi:MAG: hypothetical protein L0H26_10870, partial [Microlunatus sp.]|nr:hypothetical protein [Microlunatus sp.]
MAAHFEVTNNTASNPSIYVAAVAKSLPQARPISDEVALGRIDEVTARRMAMRSVCVCDCSGPPADHAVEAARVAVPGSAALGATGPFVASLHASMWHQGFDMWSAASYVQRGALDQGCFSLDISQLSSGGMAGLELGARQLRGHRDPARVLVTTADRFALPGIDRWRTDPGTLLGDGGTALVLSNETGFAELLSVTSIPDPELESMSRGNDKPSDVPLATRMPVSMEAGRTAMVRRFGLADFLERLQAGQLGAYEQALAAAGVGHGEIRRHVVPHLGEPRMRHQFFVTLQIDPEAST